MFLTLIATKELNEVMSTFKSRVVVEVKNMLKDFLDIYKPSTDPLLVANPTNSDTGGNSKKENASNEKINCFQE